MTARRRLGAAAEARLRHLALAALAAGLALAAAPPGPAAAAGAAGAVALLAAGAPRVAAACLGCLLAGIALGHARVDADRRGERALRPRSPDRRPGSPPHAAARGPLRHERGDPPRVRGARLRSEARRTLPVVGTAAARRAASATSWRSRAPHGDRRRAARSGFDVRAYHRRRGIAGELAVSEVRVTGAGRRGAAGVIDSARVRAERALASGLPQREAALVRGMVLGQDERIDPAVIDDFRDSGLAHLLAVSGQNVMLLAALALPLLAAAGLSRGARLAGTIALIAVVRAARRRRSVAPAGRRHGRGRPARAAGIQARLALVRAAARGMRDPRAEPARHGRPRMAAVVRRGRGDPAPRAADPRAALGAAAACSPTASP